MLQNIEVAKSASEFKRDFVQAKFRGGRSTGCSRCNHLPRKLPKVLDLGRMIRERIIFSIF